MKLCYNNWHLENRKREMIENLRHIENSYKHQQIWKEGQSEAFRTDFVSGESLLCEFMLSRI